MKKIITALTVACVAFSMSAQRASDASFGEENKSYNRIQVSYLNDHYGANKYLDEDASFSANGIGVSYVHGFTLSSSLPMYLEAGLQFNTAIKSSTLESESFDVEFEGKDYYVNAKAKEKFTNINLAVPVNFVYRFNVADNFYVSPYVGINFRVNVLGKVKDSIDIDTNLPSDFKDELKDAAEEEEVSASLYSKDDMGGSDFTWNRFQMGWQIGVGAEYNNIYLGLQYGTDFIPAFKYEDAKINNGRLAVSVGYKF